MLGGVRRWQGGERTGYGGVRRGKKDKKIIYEEGMRKKIRRGEEGTDYKNLGGGSRRGRDKINRMRRV